MPMYVARFYRNGEEQPFHTWAPFHADNETAASRAITMAMDHSRATPGGTLAPADSFKFNEVPS